MIEFLYQILEGNCEDNWCGAPVDGKLLELAAMSQEGIKLPNNIPASVLQEHERWLNLPHNQRLSRRWIYKDVGEWEAINQKSWADYFWRYL